MGAQGFLLQPPIRRTGDLTTVWDARAHRSPTHVRIRTIEERQSYASQFEWRFQVCRPGKSRIALAR
jgi:hypothetical protein